MAKSSLKLKASAPAAKKVYPCPECRADLGVEGGITPKFAICPACAGISILDAKFPVYRMLRTEEWIPLAYEPANYDFMERRFVVMDRLTAPSGPPPDGKPPR